MKDIVIIGAGGFGREIAWLIEDINKSENQWNIKGFIDEDSTKKNRTINGYKVLGDMSWFEENKESYFVCAVGNAKIKKLLIEKALNKNIKPATLIHPTVIYSNNNEIGEGAIICAGNIITVNTKIEEYVTMNLGCTLGHDSIIGKYSTIYPGVNISGQCKIGKLSEIGTKTAIRQGIKIGDRTITGAGSVIVKDTKGDCIVVGVPAEII